MGFDMKSRRFLVGVLIASLPLVVFSCKPTSGVKNQKQYEQKRAKESKKAEHDLEKMRKEHIENQSERTKDMMKATKRKSKRINRIRRK